MAKISIDDFQMKYRSPEDGTDFVRPVSSHLGPVLDSHVDYELICFIYRGHELAEIYNPSIVYYFMRKLIMQNSKFRCSAPIYEFVSQIRTIDRTIDGILKSNKSKEKVPVFAINESNRAPVLNHKDIHAICPNCHNDFILYVSKEKRFAGKNYCSVECADMVKNDFLDSASFYEKNKKCYLSEAHAIIEGKHWKGKNKCVKLPGDY